MENERVGFTIGADAGDFTRAMRDVTRDVERLERISNRSGGILGSVDDLQDYERGLQRVQRHVQGLQREYRRASDEARRFQEELDDIQKSGGSVSQGQRDRLAKLQLRQTVTGSGLKQTQDREAWAEQGQYRVRAGVENRAAAGKWAKRGLVGLGAFAIGSIIAGIQTSMEEDLSRAATEAMSGSRSFGRMEGRGLRYAMTRAQVHNMAQQTARATGRYSQSDVLSNLAMQRGYNIDPTAFQKAARMGGDVTTATVLNRSILRAIKLGGLPRVLGEELAQTTTGFLGQVAMSQENVSASGMMGLISMLGRRLGGVYGRAPGRTAGLLGGVHSTLTGGGGSEAGQAFLLRSAGFGRGKSYVQALEQLEKGTTDPRNIANLLGQVRREYGGMSGEHQRLLLYRLSGRQIKLHQARRLLALKSPEDLASVRGAMTGFWTSKEGTPEGAAGQVSSRLSLTRQAIQRQQERARTARASKPLIDAYHALQVSALKALSGGIRLVGKGATFAQEKLEKLGTALHSIGEITEKVIRKILPDGLMTKAVPGRELEKLVPKGFRGRRGRR